MPQHRERGAELNGRADALQRARCIQDERRGRKAAQQRRHGEDAEAGDQHAPAPVPVRERARGHQQRSKGEDVSAHHPFDIGEGALRSRAMEEARPRQCSN